MSKKMGRPAGFDRDAVLDKIMHTFWRYGFERTSMALLEEATGLRRPSLYNAFGDKSAMFRAATERYEDQVYGRLSETLDRQSFGAGINEYLTRQLAALSDASTPPGCLIAGGTQELGPDGDASAQAVADAERRALEIVKDRVNDATAEAEWPKNADPAKVAAAIFVLSRGMALVSRSPVGQAVAKDAAEGMV